MSNFIFWWMHKEMQKQHSHTFGWVKKPKKETASLDNLVSQFVQEAIAGGRKAARCACDIRGLRGVSVTSEGEALRHDWAAASIVTSSLRFDVGSVQVTCKDPSLKQVLRHIMNMNASYQFSIIINFYLFKWKLVATDPSGGRSRRTIVASGTGGTSLPASWNKRSEKLVCSAASAKLTWRRLGAGVRAGSTLIISSGEAPCKITTITRKLLKTVKLHVEHRLRLAWKNIAFDRHFILTSVSEKSRSVRSTFWRIAACNTQAHRRNNVRDLKYLQKCL